MRQVGVPGPDGCRGGAESIGGRRNVEGSGHPHCIGPSAGAEYPGARAREVVQHGTTGYDFSPSLCGRRRSAAIARSPSDLGLLDWDVNVGRRDAMNPYYACARCGRYAKRGEDECPFCGAARGESIAGPARCRDRRDSRGRWLAYRSSLVVVGCTSGATIQPIEAGDNPDATYLGKAVNGPMEAVADASSEGTAIDGPTDEASTDADESTADAAAGNDNIMFTPADGSFGCTFDFSSGAITLACARSQWCQGLGGGNAYSCASFDPSGGCLSLATDGGCKDRAFSWNAAACNGVSKMRLH
jgi:hypothetical protein